MAHSSAHKDFHFVQTDARFVKHLGKGTLEKTIPNVTSFLSSATTAAKRVDSEIVEVAGTSWHLSISTSVEDGRTNLTCYVCAKSSGVWHRWVEADFVLRDQNGQELERIGYSKKLFGSTPLDTDWGYTKWFTREDVLGTNNASMTVTVDFDVGIDVFSEESSLSDVTFIVEERSVFANKGHLAVTSPVFAKMFSKGFKESDADAQRHDNVLAAYRLSHYYEVDFMLEDAETFLRLPTCRVPLIEKLVLAEELDRAAFCDNLVASMSVQDVKKISEDDEKTQLSTGLMAKILKKYIELKP